MFSWSYALIIAAVISLILLSIIVKTVHYFKEHEKGLSEPLPHTRVFRTTGIGSPMGLCVFRVIVFFYSASVLGVFLGIAGINQLRFFTVWNYTLFTIFFGLASLVSLSEVSHFMRYGSYRSTAITPITWVGELVQIGYELALPMSMLVTSAQWGVLLPLALKEGKDKADMDIMFFNFCGYNMHGLNVLIMIVEFSLNIMPIEAIDAAYVVVWPSAYAVVIFILNSTVGGWPYTIVNTYTSVAPLWYAGLFLANLFFYFFWMAMSRIKFNTSCARQQIEPIVLNWGTKDINYDHDERSRLLVRKSGERYDWKTTNALYGEYSI
jgi:hypothetical protein